MTSDRIVILRKVFIYSLYIGDTRDTIKCKYKRAAITQVIVSFYKLRNRDYTFLFMKI